jgi:hypothetical protein
MLSRRHRVLPPAMGAILSIALMCSLTGCGLAVDRVPNLVGMKLPAAKADLSAAHLRFKVIYEIHSPPRPAPLPRNVVEGESPTAGDPINGKTIDLFVTT